eukprot:745871-Hanusia_phi.AAC.2
MLSLGWRVATVMLMAVAAQAFVASAAAMNPSGMSAASPVMRASPQASNISPPSKLKLTYFDLEGVAEKVRLALKVGDVPFEDERVDFASWQSLKPKTPYGQLPLLTVEENAPVTQSAGMLRYVGRLTGLYPMDIMKALKVSSSALFAMPVSSSARCQVDEVCGLQEDFAKAIAPSIYIDMQPARGTAQGDPEKAAKQPDAGGRRRKEIPRLLRGCSRARGLGLLLRRRCQDILKDNGSGFFVGDSVTIADCAMLPQLRQLQSGRLAGIPVNIVEEYPHLTNFCNKYVGCLAMS